MRRAIASIAASALALAALDAAAINKCVDPRGKVTYQSTPCPVQSLEKKVKVYAAPAASGKPAAAKAKPADRSGLIPAEEDLPDPRMDSLVATIADYEGCASADPAFARANGAKYQAWRSAHSDLVDRLPRSRHYMKVLQVERVRVQGQLGQPATRKAFVGSCRSTLAPSLAPNKTTSR